MFDPIEKEVTEQKELAKSIWNSFLTGMKDRIASVKETIVATVASGLDWVMTRLPWIILGVVVAIFLAILAAGRTYAAPLPETLTPEAQVRAVVHKVVSADPMDTGSCSAVTIAPNTALTAAHCSAISKMTIEMDNGVRYPVVAWMAAMNGQDLMLLMAPGLSCPCAKAPAYKAQADEPALAGGYPWGLAKFVTHGSIQGRIMYESSEYVLTDTPIAPGNSGGGLFVVRDGVAYLIGITVAYYAPGYSGPYLVVVVEELGRK